MAFAVAAMAGLSIASQIVSSRAGNPLLEVGLANRSLLIALTDNIHHIERGIALILKELSDLDERIYKGSLEANARSKSIEIASESQTFAEFLLRARQVEKSGTPAQIITSRRMLNRRLEDLIYSVPKLSEEYRRHPGAMGPGAFTVLLSGYLELAIQIEAVRRLDLSPIYPIETAKKYSDLLAEMSLNAFSRGLPDSALNQIWGQIYSDLKNDMASLHPSWNVPIGLDDRSDFESKVREIGVSVYLIEYSLDDGVTATDFHLNVGLAKLDWRFSELGVTTPDVDKIGDGFRWDFFEVSLPSEVTFDWSYGVSGAHPASYAIGEAVNASRLKVALPKNFFVRGDADLLLAIRNRVDHINEKVQTLAAVENLGSIIEAVAADFLEVANGDFGDIDVSTLLNVLELDANDLRTRYIEYQSQALELEAQRYELESKRLRKEINGLLLHQDRHLKEVFEDAAKASSTLAVLSALSTMLQLHIQLSAHIQNESPQTEEVIEVMDEVTTGLAGLAKGDLATTNVVKGANKIVELVKWFSDLKNVKTQMASYNAAIDAERAKLAPGQLKEFWILVKGRSFHSLAPVDQHGWLGDAKSLGTITVMGPWDPREID